MKNNKCSKCSSSDLLKLNAYKGPSNATPRSVIILTLGAFKRKKIYPSNFLCLNCGFIEQWIDSQEDLDMIAKNKNYLDSYL